jgi:CubicO group peptidase (beta-lactamase class C family)
MLSSQRLEILKQTFQSRVDQGLAPGYVIVIAHNGKLAYTSVIGFRDIEAQDPLALDTKFRIASMTKSVTAVAILTLLEQGKLKLSDPVRAFVPEIGSMKVRNPDGTLVAPDRDITILDLLTHTSGIGYRFDDKSEIGKAYLDAAPYEKANSLRGAVAIIASQDLYFSPGKQILYSYSTDVLGRVVEVAYGEPFPAYLDRAIFKPLGMQDTSFLLPESDRDRTAIVYTLPPGESLKPVAGDIFGDPFDSETWPSGGAGLISTAPDYIRFAMMLEAGGSLDGVQILSPASVDLMTADHLPRRIQDQIANSPLAGMGVGLGVAVVKDPAVIGRLGAKGDFGWGGHYDTQFFVSPEYGIGAVILTQVQPAPNAQDSDTMNLFKTLVLSSIIEKP